ncbi:efflux RND transporter periplasmic adaptor subunit [Nocardioides sp.]|uniref:efflux RND transporter periplasmic adaptor subunit n=1 Tax=Nocardioides sp. TaxID=35761 RepID=UPI0027187F90|nr:HlyD family efflux transporter periplasmic adaptor subunit [Nocardioides sp.]MDO9455731.1 HlyD family efflux transporter periplasmic adaptor subunit [Nocardioides sp.]
MRSRLTRGRRRIVVLAVVMVVTAAAAGGWFLLRPGSPAAAATSTATVATETVRETVAVSGTLEPASTADLDVAVSGTVTAVLVEPGDTVRRGEALVRVDDAALVASRRAAAATLAAAVAELAQDEDDDADDTRLAADQTAVLAARTSLAEARTAVTDATLRATQRGTVTTVGVEVGDVVGSSSGGASTGGGASTATTSTAADTSSVAAVSIVSTGQFVLEATVAAADVDQVTDGLQVEITASGVDETVYGTVSEVGRVAETSASTGAAVFPVEVAVTGSRDDLYAGTSADATVIVSQTPDVLTVSTAALQTDGDTTYVVKDGTTDHTVVEIGTTYGATTEVVSGLVAGDVVEVPGFARRAGGGQSGEGGQDQQFPGGGTPPDGAGFPGGGPMGGTP